MFLEVSAVTKGRLLWFWRIVKLKDLWGILSEVTGFMCVFIGCEVELVRN